jgi:predicted transcriptional regulator
MKPHEIQFAVNLEALSVPQCRRIVVAIYQSPLTLEQISKVCKLSQNSVAKHLEILVQAGLVRLKVIEGATRVELQSDSFQPTVDWFANFTS